MATAGDLASAISEAVGSKLGTVHFYGQALRDADLLSKSGRGTSAATMTAADATNWLLAMLLAETAGAAAETVKAARRLKVTASEGVDVAIKHDPELRFLSAKSVGELILALLDDQQERRLDPVALDIDFRDDLAVSLSAMRMHPEHGTRWHCQITFGKANSKAPMVIKKCIGNSVIEQIASVIE